MDIAKSNQTLKIMSAKILNMAGEDITPPPLSFEEQLTADIIYLFQNNSPEEAISGLLLKYNIKLIQNEQQETN